MAKKPTIKEFYATYADATNMLKGFLGGQIDWGYSVEPNIIEQLAGTPKFKTVSINVDYGRVLSPNLIGIGKGSKKNEKIADPRIRKALSISIDRDALVSGIYKNSVTAITTVMQESSPFYDNKYNNITYDVEAAKKLLEEANFDFDYEIQLFCPYSDQSSIALCEAIIQSWNKLGLKVKLTVPPPSYDWVKFTEELPYDYIYCGLTMNAPTYSYFTSDPSFGDYLKSFKEMSDSVNYEADDSKLKGMYSSLQKLEEELQPIIPIISIPHIIVYNSEVLDVSDSIFGNKMYQNDQGVTNWTQLK